MRLETDETYREKMLHAAALSLQASMRGMLADTAGDGTFQLTYRAYEKYEGEAFLVVDMGPGQPIYTHAVFEPEDNPHEGKRLLIRITGGRRMSRGKYAAQAVHAALELLGVHPHTPVIVLGGSREQVLAMPVNLRDAGCTELAPGTLTAGAEWVSGRVPDDETEPGT